MWHRLLIFLGIRNEFDYQVPCLGPEVNHPYFEHESLQCCKHCGGGRRHEIHQEPYDSRRLQEVMELERAHDPKDTRSFIERAWDQAQLEKDA